MKFVDQLDLAVEKNNSLLCIGLDVDLSRIPSPLLNSDDPIFIFNQEIIKQTKDLVCAYKPNIAFYEMYGIYGLTALTKTIEFIHNQTEIPVILDAKRADVGHSSAAYAKSIFQVFKADATTVNPYLGHDSIEPFLEYQEKGIFVLCLTSNIGFKDFQIAGADEPLYISVAKHVKEWNHYGNCGLVVGATKPEELKEIRSLVKDMPILIPGIGAQGGDLPDSVKFGTNKKGTRAIINASRSIIYAENPRNEAKKLREEINRYR
ncbi:MAG: orotidine-5'-phosphate decarboxylase [Candidatus Margulisiibacteriota bacterium]